MPMEIIDGSGSGYRARVRADNKLTTYSTSVSLQHVVSEDNESAFQIIGVANLASGTIVGLHIKNNGSVDLICTYIRHQIVGSSGGTAFPNANNYFRISANRTYSSGGTVATPVNVFVGSGNTPLITAYQGNPTLSGTATDIDRWYTKADGDMNVFNKEGALIIAPNNTMELSFVGDKTAGILYTRLSFLAGDSGE